MISSTINLTAAFPFFAIGSPNEIYTIHGISHCSLYASVWLVVDAIKKCLANLGRNVDNAGQFIDFDI